MRLSLVHSLLRQQAQAPNETATVFNGRRGSWEALANRAARLAFGLRHLGMNPGDRVGMLSLNSDRYLDYMMGVWWGGGALNPVNIRWSPAEIAYSLNDCDTRILLIDDNFLQLAPDLLQRSKALKTLIHTGDKKTPEGMISLADLLAKSEPLANVESGGDDLAGVFYTGGTTGFPKGVMLSHNALLFSALTGLVEVNYEPDEVILAVPPMFHQAGMCIVVRALVRGCKTVFVENFDPAKVIAAIEEERASFTLLVPTMLQQVVDHPDLLKKDISSLKKILYGASPISESLLLRAMHRLPQTRLSQCYGMTEAGGPYVILAWEDHLSVAGGANPKLRAAGRATWGYELQIRDGDGVEVPRGVVGEIAVRSVGMMHGYWGKPAETAAALREGWLYSGDAGYVDEDGYLFVVDRVKDMIVTGGENVYSVEVENAISVHPDVSTCAVIGIPHEHWGEAVHAVIVTRNGAQMTLDSLRAHCKELIAGYKCPVSFEQRTSLPMSGAGKFLKHVLREPYWSGHTRRVG